MDKWDGRRIGEKRRPHHVPVGEANPSLFELWVESHSKLV